MKMKYLIILVLSTILLLSIVNAVDNDTDELSLNKSDDVISISSGDNLKLNENKSNNQESVILTPIIKIKPTTIRGYAKDNIKIYVDLNAKFNDVEHNMHVGKLLLVKNGKIIKTFDLSKKDQPVKFIITLKKGDKYYLEYEGDIDKSGEIEFSYKDAKEKIPIKIKK